MTAKSKASRKKSENREFAVISYLFLLMFLGMMAYFIYFQIYEREDFINDSHNTRLDTFAENTIRGKIISEDGYVLAETVTDSSGNETRNYPYANMFSHAVGYSDRGKAGLESIANYYLLSSHGEFLESSLNELNGEKSQGDNVITTLNYDLQATAYSALGDYDGAVIVMEPSTGKVLAMVSKPDFDPNNISADWEELTSDTNDSSVLLNRATQGLYPPGSTFKIFTTLEYINENPDYYNYSFQCNGSTSSGDATIHCYKNSRHGNVNLVESFAESCNSSYASIGLTLDTDSFTQLCEKLLFNQSLPTKFPSSQSSFSLASDADDETIMQTAIGQGKTLVTPLHMLLVTSAIANDGVLMEPYFIDHTENYMGETVKKFSPTEYGKLLSEQDAAVLQDYMREVVKDGTAEELSDRNYIAAGKTGSAEFSSSSASHSWFVGYAHQDGKEDIAVAVIVERAGTGSKYAVPIAKKIFNAYYRSLE